MDLRFRTTRLFIVLSILCAVAFNGEEPRFYFSLSSGKIFAPNDASTGIEFSGEGVGNTTLTLRAFRIDDPVEFFIAQKDPHSPSLVAMEPPNTFDMISMVFRKASRDARYAVRSVMPDATRRAVRDVADINGIKAADRKRKLDSALLRVATEGDIPKGAERYKIVASWEQKLMQQPNQNWFYDQVSVPMREKGVYLVEGRARGHRAITVLIISEYGMIVKQTSTEALAFVSGMNSGERVTEMPLVFARGGSEIARVTTNDDGLASTPLPPLIKRASSANEESDEDWRWEYRQRQMLIIGEHNGNFVISDPYYYNYEDANGRIYLHTDRPIYRPGQTVYYRGIARTADQNGVWQNPNGTDSMIVEIETPTGDLIRRDTTRLSDMGTFFGEIAVDSAAPLGNYSIKVRRVGVDANSARWFDFDVEEYKKPEYRVTVTTDKPIYTRGDSITANVKASYYFGSPVSTAEVEYFVYRSLYQRPWWHGSDWAYLYEAGGEDQFMVYRMEMIASGNGAISPDGTFAIGYRTDPVATADYVYHIQANVVDASRRSISGERSVEVTRGEFAVASRTDRYVYHPGDEVKVEASIARFDDNTPVATSITAKVIRTWWEKATKPDSAGEYAYTKKTEDVWSGTGATGADGKGIVTWEASRPGYFSMEITARDARGTQISSSSYIYVADKGYVDWYREGSGDVQIIPDREAYRPGETLSALVIMPAPQIDALVTLEGSTIFAHRVERLNETSVIVRFVMDERHAPNVYLSASAIVNGEMYTEMKSISVIPEGRLLKLDITTDREMYRPGDKGNITVRVVDESGSAVSNVDVALAVVDEALFAIRPDGTPDVQRVFYGNRWNQVETSSSLNFSFYGNARRIDPDATDALYGSLSPRRPDEFGRRGADPNSKYARTISYGDVKGEMFVQPNVRRNFKDMMFWTPSARTGADGTVKLDVQFPDNLTTWRITAHAIGPNSSVGSAVARVVARKELMVRMETPRFIREGDEFLVATTIHNYLSTEKTAKVVFTATGVTTAERQRTVTLPSKGDVRIDWRITAPAAGTATLEVKALTDEESDAMELRVPILRRGMQMASGVSTDLQEGILSGTMALSVPTTGVDPKSASMTVTLSPSIAGSVVSGLDSLIGYPYGCVEQTMSRFLPTIVVADALERLNAPFDSLRRKAIPKMVTRSLARLYSMQQDEDGGWGWWERGGSDPFMTAYVVHGLTQAMHSGFTVRTENYTRGVAALTKGLQEGKTSGNRPIDATSEAFMVYSLSQTRPGATQRLVVDRMNALLKRDTLSNYARALLALVAVDQGMKTQASSIVALLESRATISGDKLYWSGPNASSYWRWQDDPVETTAMALRAIMAVRGQTDILRRGVRWLLTQKIGGSWGSTRRSAMVIFTLVDYLKRSNELTPNYTVVVRVNGREVATEIMDQQDLFNPATTIAVDASSLKPGPNTVTIEKRGSGQLYADAHVSYFATGAALSPSSAGFSVRREYFQLKRERRGDILVHTKSPFGGTLKSGDLLLVKVTVKPERAYQYVMLEDPLPAGCEVVSNTTGMTITGEPEYDTTGRSMRSAEWLQSNFWWNITREIRDTKVAFFADRMLASEESFTYVLRAQIPGDWTAMPSVASLMYFPEIRGNGAVQRLRITE